MKSSATPTNLLVTAIEEGQKGCLSARRTLHTSKAQFISNSGYLLQVHEKILHHDEYRIFKQRDGQWTPKAHLDPQTRAFPHGCKLSRLKVSEAKCGQVGVLLSESTQSMNATSQFRQQQIQTIAHHN